LQPLRSIHHQTIPPFNALFDCNVAVFHPRKDHEGAHDNWQDVTQGTVEEMVDARISIFTEMGFTAKQAEDALKLKNNDVNEALNMLLQAKK
jgi:uncharacterized UBP type Zn finger protein